MQENFCAVNFLTVERNFHLNGLSFKKFQQWNQQHWEYVVDSENFPLDDNDFSYILSKFQTFSSLSKIFVQGVVRKLRHTLGGGGF